MELINALSNEDKDKFYKYTGKFCGSTSYNDRAPVETILAEWDKQKTSLYNIFGKQFILEKEINYEKCEFEVLTNLQAFFNTPTYREFSIFGHNYCAANIEAGQFPWHHPLYDELNSTLLVNDNFYENSYHGNTIRIPIPGTENEIVITKGMKMMKILRKIHTKLPEYFTVSDEQLEKDIVIYSQCVNTKNTHGTLCLSIHPLDFITASDNECDWDSCMTYSNEGDYRRGIIEMMNSPIVICAYLKASNNMGLIGGATWNNKKWREFFIVRDDIISGIKGYPFWTKDLETIVISWIKELSEKYYNVQYGDLIEFQPDHRDDLGHSFKMSTREHAMYNDFYQGNTYLCCITDKFDYEVIVYPGNATCMWCGMVSTSTLDYDSSSCVCCFQCGADDSDYCECCGARTDSDDLTEVDGEYWCSYCVDQYAGYSDVDRGYHRNDYIYEVHLASRVEQKASWEYTFRYHNDNWNDNDFNDIPYPIYEQANGNLITFIEDIKTIDNGKAVSLWIWNFDRNSEMPIKFVDNIYNDNYYTLDPDECVENSDSLELIHKGNKSHRLIF